jgi:hypothetical protein
MSERTTFLSAMTVRSIILALRAVLSPSVLWQTLRYGSAKETNKICQDK